jgi:hypothetical protein
MVVKIIYSLERALTKEKPCKSLIPIAKPSQRLEGSHWLMEGKVSSTAPIYQAGQPIG